MRTTITIPDEFYSQIKENLAPRGFSSVNDYILSLIRNDSNKQHILRKQEEFKPEEITKV